MNAKGVNIQGVSEGRVAHPEKEIKSLVSQVEKRARLAHRWGPSVVARAEARFIEDTDGEGPECLFWITEVLASTDLNRTRSKIGKRI